MTAASIVSALREKGRTVCAAESLTGGLLSSALCDVPGASACFRGGVCAYQDDVKESLLSVSPETIGRFTAVSAACAREMAAGARKALGADYALATTGYAGPGGDDVGLVFVALAGAGGVSVYRLRLSGTRAGIRNMTVQFALYLLQKEIKSHG